MVSSYGNASILLGNAGFTRDEAFIVAIQTAKRLDAMDRFLKQGIGYVTIFGPGHLPVWSWSLKEGRTLDGVTVSTALELLETIAVSNRIEKKAIRWLRSLAEGRRDSFNG